MNTIKQHKKWIYYVIQSEKELSHMANLPSLMIQIIDNLEMSLIICISLYLLQ